MTQKPLTSAADQRFVTFILLVKRTLMSRQERKRGEADGSADAAQCQLSRQRWTKGEESPVAVFVVFFGAVWKNKSSPQVLGQCQHLQFTMNKSVLVSLTINVGFLLGGAVLVAMVTV